MQPSGKFSPPGPLPATKLAGSAKRGRSWMAHSLAWAPLLGITVLGKFGVPPLAERGIGLALPMLFISVIVGLLLKRLVIVPQRLIALCLIFGVISVVQIASGMEISISAITLLLVLCFLIVFEDSGVGPAPVAGQEVFIKLAIFFSILGLYQFVAQKGLPFAAVKPVDAFVPDSFLVKGYNSVAMASYKSELFRPNGIFFLEPSFYSQFVALAIVIELFSVKRRLWHIGLFLCALITSISGTGIIVLMVGSTVLVSAPHGRSGLILLIALAAGFALFHDELGMTRIWERMSEFNRPGTSSYERFIVGFHLLSDYFSKNPWQIMFGFGAGQFSREIKAMYDAADTALIKMLFEYGLVGAALITGIFARAVYLGSRSLPVTLSLMAIFLMGGIAIPFFYGIALPLGLWERRKSDDKSPAPFAATVPAPAPGTFK